MKRCIYFLAVSLLFGLFLNSAVFAQQQNKPERYTFVRRADSKEGDYKVVVVPVTNKRQAMLDAQTYHIGWNAVDAWMGQSRVMYCVLLKKRPPYVPGQPPVTRRIPRR